MDYIVVIGSVLIQFLAHFRMALMIRNRKPKITSMIGLDTATLPAIQPKREFRIVGWLSWSVVL